MICDRCGTETYSVENCEYCGKKVGRECVKSSKRIGKTRRIVICKDCWSDMKKRHLFKSA